MKNNASMKPKPEFTEEQIYRMRQFLARGWHQSISQVTDAEARAYLLAQHGTARTSGEGK